MDIKIKKYVPDFPIEKLNHFQGDLKYLGVNQERKLLKLIKDDGFIKPIYAFENSKSEVYILDGHQRIHVILSHLKHVKKVPVIFVEVKNKKHAKKLVLQFNTSHGAISKTSFLNFCDEANLNSFDLEPLEFPSELASLAKKEIKQIEDGEELDCGLNKVLVIFESESKARYFYEDLIKKGVECELKWIQELLLCLKKLKRLFI